MQYTCSDGSCIPAQLEVRWRSRLPQRRRRNRLRAGDLQKPRRNSAATTARASRVRGAATACTTIVRAARTKRAAVPKVAMPAKFACRDGKCIPDAWVCDGVYHDCSAGEDESTVRPRGARGISSSAAITAASRRATCATASPTARTATTSKAADRRRRARGMNSPAPTTRASRRAACDAAISPTAPMVETRRAARPRARSISSPAAMTRASRNSGSATAWTIAAMARTSSVVSHSGKPAISSP